MIFKLDGKQAGEDLQNLFNMDDREYQYSLIQYPEIEKTAFQ